MQCYDCIAENRTTPAVAVCSTCGAGLCLTHTVMAHADERTSSVGNPSATRLPGRRILCHTCSTSGAEEETLASAGSIVDTPDA